MYPIGYGTDRAENNVGRREITFDSRVDYLPTSMRVFLVDQSGKSDVREVKTTWERYKTDQWRPSKCVASFTLGSDKIVDTHEYTWAEPEQLDDFLSRQDLKTMIKDDHSNWSKVFFGLFERQKELKPSGVSGREPE